MSEKSQVSQERILELIEKAIELAMRDDLPPDHMMTKEAIGTTQEEFEVICRIFGGPDIRLP